MNNVVSRIRFLIVLGCFATLASCFRTAIPLQHKTHYPVDVFYDNQRPERPFDPIQDLEIKGAVPTAALEDKKSRRLARGNDAQQKELMLTRLATQAKKIGANALVDVRYTYYTSMSETGYVMTGLAVKYKQEYETSQK